jgi:flavin-dependent dehydrogenase
MRKFDPPQSHCKRMISCDANMILPHETDVFIVGGGPAGLAAAIAARARGLRVIVADGNAPPIEKPCGEGMSPETLAALAELGVNLANAGGVSIKGIAFVQPTARVSGDFPQGPGLGLRRTALHARLFARAEECGVELLWHTPVTAIAPHEVHLANARSFGARWIVGADGANSRVRQSLKIPTRSIRRRFAARRHYRIDPWSSYVEVHWGQRAQAYVTPVSPAETSVVILAVRREDAVFDHAILEFPEIAARIAKAQLASHERGAVTAQHQLAEVTRGNVALVGDASGGVDAITGDGIRLALLHAQVLAGAMEANDLSLYSRAHCKLASAPTRAGAALLLLDRSPRIRERVLAALAANPQLFESLLAAHVGHGTRRDLVATGAELGWRVLAT